MDSRIDNYCFAMPGKLDEVFMRTLVMLEMFTKKHPQVSWYSVRASTRVHMLVPII